ncbi:ergot alkaloid A [Suillus lakei]|nr:ergot alkaloid A [Suillus lakei]
MSTSPKSTVLLLGSTGKIASRIAPFLSAAGYTTLLASRSGISQSSLNNCHGVKFDWFDSSTWSPLFTSHLISTLFMIAPPILDCVPLMKSFIDLALQHHVKRLVLLSASLMDVGDGPNFSEVSGYIAGLGVEWAVLRPTWFMENFSEQQYLPSIRDEDRILTATGEGRVPFISAEDIADVAYRALVDERSHDTDHLILGPELFSYDEIAEIFTKALGRTITHVKITEDQLAAGMEQWGILPDYARMLAGLDTAIKDGKENRLNDVVLKVTGHPPKKFEVYLGECTARGVWDKKS